MDDMIRDKSSLGTNNYIDNCYEEQIIRCVRLQYLYAGSSYTTGVANRMLKGTECLGTKDGFGFSGPLF